MRYWTNTRSNMDSRKKTNAVETTFSCCDKKRSFNTSVQIHRISVRVSGINPRVRVQVKKKQTKKYDVLNLLQVFKKGV